MIATLDDKDGTLVNIQSGQKLVGLFFTSVHIQHEDLIDPDWLQSALARIIPHKPT